MCSQLDDSAIIDHSDSVGFHRRCKAVSDQNRRTALKQVL
jgi:hypothetical protein